jgi:hypothetical protein
MGKNGLGRLLKRCFGLGRMRLRARSSRVGSTSYSIKSTKLGLDSVHGFKAFSVGLNSSLGTILGSESSTVVVGSSSLTPKALGCSSVEFSVSYMHAFSSPHLQRP